MRSHFFKMVAERDFDHVELAGVFSPDVAVAVLKRPEHQQVKREHLDAFFDLRDEF